MLATLFFPFFLNLRHIFLKGLFRPFTTSSEKAQSLFASIIYIFFKKSVVQICFLRLYLGIETVSCRLLQRMARTDWAKAFKF